MNMNTETPYRAPRAIHNVSMALAAVGLLSFGGGLAVDPNLAWGNLLLASFFLVGLGLAGALCMAFQYLTAAGWSVALRRVPEAMTAPLPWGSAGLLFVFFAQPSLYPWTASQSGGAHQPSAFQHWWLNWSFFLGRAVVYLALWNILAWALVANSRRQDLDGDLRHTRANVRLSALCLVVFGITFWLASYDWLMSLMPHWYSTIFGLYQFAGLFLGGLAVLALMTAALYRLGPLRSIVRVDHMHDLGKLLFAFSTFWMYIWYCQYMLIWYVNIPEETLYYIERVQEQWASLFWLNVILNWAIPFAVLLPRESKRRPVVLGNVALVILCGRWLDLSLNGLPFLGDQPLVGFVVGFGIFLGAISVFILSFFGVLGQVSLVPCKDPYLVESLGNS